VARLLSDFAVGEDRPSGNVRYNPADISLELRVQRGPTLWVASDEVAGTSLRIVPLSSSPNAGRRAVGRLVSLARRDGSQQHVLTSLKPRAGRAAYRRHV